MKAIMRSIFKAFCRMHPYENGKYQILMKLYYPFIAPKEDKYLVSDLKYGIRMNLNIKEYVQAFLYNYGTYEYPTIKFFSNFVKNGMTIIDVGANVGYHSLILSKFTGEKGRVFSFEPESKNIKILDGNIKLNNFKNIKIITKAASNFNGTIKLFLSNSDNLGVHSTVYIPENVSQNFTEIEAVKLDDFVVEENIDKVDFVKVDVEGAETDVLAGMDKILKKHRPIVVLELVEKLQNMKGFSTKDVKKMMKETYNYDSFQILNNGEIKKLSIESIQYSDNVVFIPIN